MGSKRAREGDQGEGGKEGEGVDEEDMAAGKEVDPWEFVLHFDCSFLVPLRYFKPLLVVSAAVQYL